MGHVPHQHVRVVQHVLGQAVARLIQRGCGDDTAVPAQVAGNRAVGCPAGRSGNFRFASRDGTIPDRHASPIVPYDALPFVLVCEPKNGSFERSVRPSHATCRRFAPSASACHRSAARRMPGSSRRSPYADPPRAGGVGDLPLRNMVANCSRAVREGASSDRHQIGVAWRCNLPAVRPNNARRKMPRAEDAHVRRGHD